MKNRNTLFWMAIAALIAWSRRVPHVDVGDVEVVDWDPDPLEEPDV